MNHCDYTSEKLANIFLNKLGINIHSFNGKIFDEELLGMEFRMTPRDLVYLFFEIEREFNITIPQEDIVAKKFNTFNNIVNIIENQISKKEKNVV